MTKLYTIFLLIVSVKAYTQSSVGIYNFDHTPQAALLNPAYDYGQNQHVTIPFLSHQLFVGNTGIKAHDILAANATPFLDKVKNTVNSMSANDVFLGQQHMDIVYLGFKKNQKQYTFGLYQETDFFSSFPKDIALLFFDGNETIGKTYTLNGLNTQANVTGVYHFGIQQAYDAKTSLGFRAKIYSGSADVRVNKPTADIKTVAGTQNLYGYDINNIDVQIHTTGLNLDNEKELNTGYALKQLFFSGNYGLGLDVGITKQINKNLYVSSSINDLGFIYYRKDNTSFTAQGNYHTEGIDLNYNGTTPEAYWDNFENDFLQQTHYEETKEKYMALRPVQWSNFLRFTIKRSRLAECTPKPFEDDGLPKTAVGVYTNLFLYNGNLFPSGSLFYENRLGKALSLRAHYTADRFSATNIGVATYVKVWKLNLFANVDNVFGFIDLAQTKTTGVQFGINYMN